MSLCKGIISSQTSPTRVHTRMYENMHNNYTITITLSYIY